MDNKFLTEQEVCTLFKFKNQHELSLAIEQNRIPKPIKTRYKNHRQNLYRIIDLEYSIRNKLVKLDQIKKMKQTLLQKQKTNKHNLKRNKIIRTRRLKFLLLASGFLIIMYALDNIVKSLF